MSNDSASINADEYIELEVLAKLLAQPEIHEAASRAMADEEISREEFFRQTALGIRAAYGTMAQELMKAQERASKQPSDHGPGTVGSAQQASGGRE